MVNHAVRSLGFGAEPGNGIVVVGAGYAAGELAMKLRQSGYAGQVILVGAERHLPYHRPPLSKSFLAREIKSTALLLRPDAAYEKAGIGFIGGAKVERIDRPARSIALADGRTLGYDSLVLATGGRARELNCPGSNLRHIHYLRTLDDVEAIHTQMSRARRLTIVGGGYIGLEVAAVAVKLGLSVTLIEAAPRLLARVTGVEISAFYETVHRDAGVVIHTGVTVERFGSLASDPTAVGTVALSDGRVLDTDFVIAGVGLIPNAELAEAAGLIVRNGIEVDEFCRTMDPAILAIGDCSNHPSAFLGCRVRLESVPNALEQARVAAATLTGTLSPYAAVPWFWSDQYDLKLQAVGLSQGHDQVVIRGCMSSRSFIVFYLRRGCLIAADAVNRVAEFMAAKRLVGAAVAPDPGALGNPAVSLKSLIPAGA